MFQMWKTEVTMKLGVIVFVVALSATTLSSAIPKPDEQKNRVVDKVREMPIIVCIKTCIMHMGNGN